MKQLLLFFLFFLSYVTTYGQQNTDLRVHYPNGLSFHGLAGYQYVRDELISSENYHGYPFGFNIEWARFNDKEGMNLTFEMINAAAIENYTMQAKMSELSINYCALYSIGKLEFFHRKAYFYLGPSPEIYFYYREENIAKGGASIFSAYSALGLFSLGANIYCFLPLNDNFQFEGNVQPDILAFAIKMKDLSSKESSFAKLLLLSSMQKFSFEAALRYTVNDLISLKAGYKFYLARVTAWDYLMSVRDNLSTTITISL